MDKEAHDILSEAWEPLIEFALAEEDNEPYESFNEEYYDPLEYDPW